MDLEGPAAIPPKPQILGRRFAGALSFAPNSLRLLAGHPIPMIFCSIVEVV
jgi:hypothetical protein